MIRGVILRKFQNEFTMRWLSDHFDTLTVSVHIFNNIFGELKKNVVGQIDGLYCTDRNGVTTNAIFFLPKLVYMFVFKAYFFWRSGSDMLSQKHVFLSGWQKTVVSKADTIPITVQFVFLVELPYSIFKCSCHTLVHQRLFCYFLKKLTTPICLVFHLLVKGNTIKYINQYDCYSLWYMPLQLLIPNLHTFLKWVSCAPISAKKRSGLLRLYWSTVNTQDSFFCLKPWKKDLWRQ